MLVTTHRLNLGICLNKIFRIAIRCPKSLIVDSQPFYCVCAVGQIRGQNRHNVFVVRPVGKNAQIRVRVGVVVLVFPYLRPSRALKRRLWRSGPRYESIFREMREPNRRPLLRLPPSANGIVVQTGVEEIDGDHQYATATQLNVRVTLVRL